MSHAELRTGVIFTKFELGQPIRSWLIASLLVIRYVTLWPWPLDHQRLWWRSVV